MHLNRKLSYILLLTVGTNVWAENGSSTSGNFETSAKIEKFCAIKGNNINFGVVLLPLTTQGSNSKINILCSSETAYKVDLVYGGIYIDPEKVTFGKYTGPQSNGDEYYVVTETGQSLGRIGCGNSRAGYYGYVYFETKEVADLYGAPQNPSYIPGIWTFWIKDNFNACNAATMTPKKSSQGIFLNGSGGDFGTMSGLLKKDKLAYKITIPSDSTKVWKKGVNSYEDIGSGLDKEISVNATIIPESSSSKYIAGDSYVDTVIAEIIY